MSTLSQKLQSGALCVVALAAVHHEFGPRTCAIGYHGEKDGKRYEGFSHMRLAYPYNVRILIDSTKEGNPGLRISYIDHVSGLPN